MAKAKSSPSNVIERQPIQKKGKADQKGANGAALAAVYIKDAEHLAAQTVKVEVSMKDRLRSLEKLTREDHLEFRAALVARQELISQEATKAGLTLTLYREADRADDVVYVTCSLWAKMSSAVETGWKPNYDTHWSEISKAATASLDKAKAMAEQTAIKQQIATLESDKNIKPNVKQAQLVILSDKLEKAAIRANPTAHTSGTTSATPAAPKTLMQLIEALKPQDFPAQQIEEAAKQLMALYAEKMKRPVPATPSNRPLNEERAPKETETDTEKPVARASAKRSRK
jgi:hypothetical protein